MISAVIIAKNAEDKLSGCLESLKGWADEIVVLDTGSTDKTVEIARKFGAKVGKFKHADFATWRNKAAKLAKGEWLFYIDHDERVSIELKEEILAVVGNRERSYVSQTRHRPWTVDSQSAFDIPRKNYVFGRWLKHGGWWPDKVLRLMRKDALIKWEGEVHEQPKINGRVGSLKNPFIHLKEDNLSDMVEKTNRYSVYEAKLLFEAKHPAVTWWRFISVIIRELWYRLFTKLGILDGPEGILYCVYQGYSRFVTYAKLWEMQEKSKIKN